MYYYGCDIVRVVDGNTIDVTVDLGFNVAIRERVTLYGVKSDVYTWEFARNWISQREPTSEFELHSIDYCARNQFNRCIVEIFCIDGITGSKESLNAAIIAAKKSL